MQSRSGDVENDGFVEDRRPSVFLETCLFLHYLLAILQYVNLEEHNKGIDWWQKEYGGIKNAFALIKNAFAIKCFLDFKNVIEWRINLLSLRNQIIDLFPAVAKDNI